MSANVEDTLFSMLADLAPGKSVSPEDVAKAVDPESWRRLLPQIRATVRGLARQGRVVITRHGKPADPEAFKGVYRLRAPQPSDGVEPQPGGDAEPV